MKAFIEKVNKQEIFLSMVDNLKPGKPLIRLINTWYQFKIGQENLRCIQEIYDEFDEQTAKYSQCQEWI